MAINSYKQPPLSVMRILTDIWLSIFPQVSRDTHTHCPCPCPRQSAEQACARNGRSKFVPITAPLQGHGCEYHRAPSQGLESRFCCWTAGQGLSQKERSFADTGMTCLGIGRRGVLPPAEGITFGVARTMSKPTSYGRRSIHHPVPLRRIRECTSKGIERQGVVLKHSLETWAHLLDESAS